MKHYYAAYAQSLNVPTIYWQSINEPYTKHGKTTAKKPPDHEKLLTHGQAKKNVTEVGGGMWISVDLDEAQRKLVELGKS